MNCESHQLREIVVVGGAGFIGGHFVDRLLSDDQVSRVRVYDNFSSGRKWHIEQHLDDQRLDVVRADVRDIDTLAKAFEGFETVIHLASNPDIARAATEPAIDFEQGTFLTHHVVEAMRMSGVQRILYASGSGVYGDLGELEVSEDFGPLIPVSTYGASKLAGEAMIASYCHMFDLVGCAFRFGNVVGPHQTHGVGYDFLLRLLENPNELTILGNGLQSKSYIHVKDVIDAVLLASTRAPKPFATFNVATGDYITVNEIANLVMSTLGLAPESVDLVWTGTDRGWRGDVPIVRLDTKKIRSLGWTNSLSTRDALEASLKAMLVDAKMGRLT